MVPNPSCPPFGGVGSGEGIAHVYPEQPTGQPAKVGTAAEKVGSLAANHCGLGPRGFGFGGSSFLEWEIV